MDVISLPDLNAGGRPRAKLVGRAVEKPILSEARFADRIGRMPYFRKVGGAASPMVRVEGRSLFNLASNNYLALTTDRRVVRAATDAIRLWGTGVTGSRLMNGTLTLHEHLEADISDFFGYDAALVLPTGYTANLGLLAGLLRPSDTAVVDRDIHASCYDGVRLSGAQLVVAAHNEPADFEEKLRATGAALCVIEGAYSMSGDVAPVAEIADACHKHDVMIVVDEAHAVGVLGDRGRGASELADALSAVDALTITFSKSLGSCGGAIVGSRELIDCLRFAARPFMFTASNTPGALAAAHESLRILCEHPEYPAAVRELAAGFAERLRCSGIDCRYSGGAIISVPCGSDFLTAQAWKMLWNRGVFCNAAISPAVERDNGALRFSVMRTHDYCQLLTAADCCAEVLLSLRTNDHLSHE